MSKRDITVSEKMQMLTGLSRHPAYEDALPALQKYKHNMVAAAADEIEQHNAAIEKKRQEKLERKTRQSPPYFKLNLPKG